MSLKSARKRAADRTAAVESMAARAFLLQEQERTDEMSIFNRSKQRKLRKISPFALLAPVQY